MTDRRLTLGHSPDPDDAFMFYGFAEGLLDAAGWRFQHVLQDIQTLNERALRGELDITAISIHAYPYVADKYALTNCGSSMGDGYGPMIVAREPMAVEDLAGKHIAIPGEMTTAFLAAKLLLGGHTPSRAEHPNTSEPRTQPVPTGSGVRAAPPAPNALQSTRPLAATTPSTFRHTVVMFDQILNYVADGKADAGLIIHEGQLTYHNQRLHCIVDLGRWWKDATGLPLPLGGNCIRRDLGPNVMTEVAGILKRSIEFSLAHREDAVAHALQYARDMGTDLADKFVGMYVNKWTIDYGDDGREAVRLLLRTAHAAGLVPAAGDIDFVG